MSKIDEPLLPSRIPTLAKNSAGRFQDERPDEFAPVATVQLGASD
jgi:hypothetical protein